MSTKIFIFAIGWLTSLVLLFAGGWYFHDLMLISTNITIPTKLRISEIPPPQSPPPQNNITTDYIPFEWPLTGASKVYFEDTITAFVMSDPPYVVVSTYSRQQGETNFIHNARTSFFDGIAWHRNTDTKTSSDTRFIPNSVISQLNIFQAKDRVLRQKINTNITIDNQPISITSGELENETTIRAEPTYTRLLSDGTGTLRINNKTYPARILYAKWYSMDNSKLVFYDKEFGVVTRVIDFWGEDGSVIHIDTTDVDKATEIYAPHKIGVIKDSLGRLKKDFNLLIKTSSEMPPSTWHVQLNHPEMSNLQFSVTNILKRAEGPAYNWYRGLGKGFITDINGKTINGWGTFEYIQEQK